MFKKILCMLLCLWMLGTMVACDDTPPTVPQIPEDNTPATSDPNSGESTPAASSSNDQATTTTPASAVKEELWVKVATYNVVHCQDQSVHPTQPNPANIVKVIKDEAIDICGLNEVDRNAARSAGYDQPKWIAEKLTRETGDAYYWAFATATVNMVPAFNKNYADTDGNALYGNALISKYPIVSCHEVPVSIKENQVEDGYERRVLLVADIKIDERILTVIVSHFDLKADARAKAVDLIEDELSGIKNPVVVMGDFNCSYNSTPIQRLSQKLRNTASGQTPYTYPSTAPSQKIDYIFVSKTLQTKNHTVPNYQYSDHCPVVVQFRWS